MKGWVWTLIGAGWYVALCILLGAALGLWLDRRLGTAPFLALLGILLGSFLAFFGLYKMLQPGLKGKDNRKE